LNTSFLPPAIPVTDERTSYLHSQIDFPESTSIDAVQFLVS
jgi:hypothetical protein